MRVGLGHVWDDPSVTGQMREKYRQRVRIIAANLAPVVERQVRESVARELSETVRLRREEHEWSESRKDYHSAGWQGGPDDGDRMFWSAGFKRGFDLAVRIARGES
jgi:hypothetical protein